MIINYHGNMFTATIEELAHMTQIPFKFLYEAYVNSDFNKIAFLSTKPVKIYRIIQCLIYHYSISLKISE